MASAHNHGKNRRLDVVVTAAVDVQNKTLRSRRQEIVAGGAGGAAKPPPRRASGMRPCLCFAARRAQLRGEAW